MSNINKESLENIFRMLAARLESSQVCPQRLVVCGGAALIATGLLSRTTTDVDIVALVSEQGELVSPVPLPELLVIGAKEVAAIISLPQNWLNNGPSANEGGLFQMDCRRGCKTGFTKKNMDLVYPCFL